MGSSPCLAVFFTCQNPLCTCRLLMRESSEADVCKAFKDPHAGAAERKAPFNVGHAGALLNGFDRPTDSDKLLKVLVRENMAT
jgi:hypothetical protein